MTRLDRPVAWLLLALLAAVPLLYPAVPPLSDVPAHMARYRVMLAQPGDPLLALYDFSWRPIGNLGVDLSVWALAPLIGLEPAVKAITLAIPAGTAAALLWLSHLAHGRAQPTALLAIPLAYNLAFTLGFLNYTLAMTLALGGLALWLALADRPGLRAALFVPLALALWFVHVFGWVGLAAMTGSAEIARRRRDGSGWIGAIRPAIVAALPLAPPALLLLLWRPDAGGGASDLVEGLLLKPGWLAGMLRDRWLLLDVAATALLAILLYRWARHPDARWSPEMAGAAAGLLLLFLILPFGAAYADARIAPYAAMLALVAIAPPPREQRATLLIAGAFLLVRLAAATASFAIEARDWDRRLAVVDAIPPGARVAALIGTPCAPPWAIHRITHLPGLAVVRRGAFTNDGLDTGAAGLLQVGTAPPGFARDPSQMVVARPCPDAPEYRTLDTAIAALPDWFDHLWLIDPPAPVRLPPGWRVRARSGGDTLYVRDRSGG